MTRKDRLNRLRRAEQDKQHINKFLDPHGNEPNQPDEQADPEQAEQQDPPVEQADSNTVEKAKEPEKLPYQRPGWHPPELTEARRRRIDARDARLRGQVSAYAATYYLLRTEIRDASNYMQTSTTIFPI